MTPQVHNRTADVDGDGIDSAAETLDLDSDDEAQHSQSNRSGFTFVPAESLDGLECRISEKSEGLVTAYLTTDSGTVLERRTIASLDPGETFAFDARLEANATYWIVCDARGRNFVRGRAEVDYPIENDLLTVTNGIFSGSGAESTSYRYCIDRIGPVQSAEREGAIDLESDDEGQSWGSLNDRSGVRLRTTERVDGLECRLSERSEGLVTGYLTTDSGDVIERQTIAVLEAGDTVTFETELEADETYRVVFDARGRSYVRGRAAVDYPLESGSLAVTDGIYGSGQLSDSYRYCIDRIGPADAGTVPETSFESETESTDEDSDTDTLELGSDEVGQAWSSLDEPSGVRFRVDEAVDDVTCRLSSETVGVTTAVLTDGDGDVLEEQSVDDLEAGDTFAFDADLEAGETYGILLDADGESYVRGRTAADYPLESAVIEATHGIYSGDYESESYRYCVDRITVSIADSEPSEPEESEPEESDSAESTIDLGDDEEAQSWGSLDQPSGVRFRADEDLSRVTGQLSAETDGVTTASLTDDDGETLEERSIADLEAGETFSFETDLEAGETYWVVCDADGESYARGRAAADYPLEDDLLSVTHGIYGGYLETDSYRYCLDQLSVESAGSGSGSGGYETETEETELDLGNDEEGQSWSTLDRRSGVRFRVEEDLSTVAGRLSASTATSSRSPTGSTAATSSPRTTGTVSTGSSSRAVRRRPTRPRASRPSRRYPHSNSATTRRPSPGDRWISRPASAWSRPRAPTHSSVGSRRRPTASRRRT
ncbi:hypothetical protein QA600_18000 [Natronococcus sp. A-GB1]|uniref:hypothetical protein n=1 Tax=Natronococcus sp. A-GB1 TaxID=3037648 RepID=UPI00241E747F|nr:hypothetical protein [Natronococcus sp. A-GB1]MDG5761225.1 hypothetical protein [Natronococcus sp. A-GB1]